MDHTRVSATWKLHELVISALVILASVYFLTTPYYALSIVPGLGVILIYILWRWPQAALYGIVFSLPYSSYSAISEYFTVTQIFGGVLILILAAKIILNRIPIEKLGANLWKWAFFFLVISFFSAYLSHYKETSYGNLKNILIAFTIIAFTLTLISSRGMSRTLPAILTISITISSVLLTIGSIFEISYFYIGAALPEDNRISGTSEDPNEMASMIVFLLPLLIHMISRAEKGSHKIFLSILLVTNVAAVILTYSRSAGLIMAIMFAVILARKVRNLRASQIGFGLTLAAGILAGTVILTPGTYWERQKTVFYSGSYIEDGSLAGRLSFILAARDVFPQNPFIGAGPGTYRDKYAETVYAPQFGYDENKQGREAAHNAYLEILIGQGLLGLLFYVLLIWVSWKNFTKARKMYMAKGNAEFASLTQAYRLSLFTLLLFFLFLSIPYDKYFLMTLALSQLALRYAQQDSGPTLGDANGPGGEKGDHHEILLESSP